MDCAGGCTSVVVGIDRDGTAGARSAIPEHEICRVVRSAELHAMPNALIDLVRLRSGALAG